MLPIEFFRRAVLQHQDRIALEDSRQSICFAELAHRVDAIAAALQDRINTAGTRVGLCATNSVDHVTALLACLAAGMIWVPLNPRLGKAELEAVLALARPELILCEDGCRDRLPDWDGPIVRLAPQKNGPCGPCTADWVSHYAGKQPTSHFHDPSVTQAIKFTSGSSGKPKGVVQSCRSWNVHAASITQAFGFARDERFLAVAPITHGTSCFLLPVLAAGGTIVIGESPKPDAVLTALVEREITATYLTPTMIYNLLSEPGARDSSFSRMRHLIYSGAPMRLEQIRETLAVFPSALETCYGQAEAPQIISYMRGRDFMDRANHGSVGFPGLLVQIGILDEAMHPLAAGEVGEICVRGDLIADGYLDNPEAEAEAFREGWLRTGDLGRFDGNGRLWIEGRKKEVIISGGFNIYPKDVENALGRHPAVLECTVFGVEDPKWGEAVHAAIELHADATADERELIDFVKRTLDSVKAPKRIHTVDSLPRNAVGKIMRREAKAMVMETAE